MSGAAGSRPDLAALYLATVVTIEEAGRLVPAAESALVRSGPVHVITAWNPGAERPSLADNRAADARLRAGLAARGLAPVRALGSDPASDHAEESWAVAGLDDDTARAVGAEFGQVAVFRLRDGVQTVLACTEAWTVSRPL
ncbi:MAG: DUF3293 domain-containing protein [Actinomycetota bacterium]